MVDITELTDEQLEEAIEQQKHYIFCKECSDDFYYTKGSYYSDERYLKQLKAELKKRKEGEKGNV